MSVAIRIENVSKLYRLGTIGTGTIAHDLNRWWCLARGKDDPYAKVGQINDRTQSSIKNQEPGTEKNAAPDYVWALKDINLEVMQGEILGIIGRNGAGKSTLLKLLSRVTTPTTGSIRTKGRIASLLEVGTGFHPELTGRENIYMNGSILGMRWREITKQLDDIVEFSGCARYLDTPVKRYSSGMTVRLGFAVAAHLEPEILIVDEVLAVGDAEFQKRCLGKLDDVARAGRTVLFVSHSMPAIRQLTVNCVVIEDGHSVFHGKTFKALELYNDVSVVRASAPDAISKMKRNSWAGDQRVRFKSAENLSPIISRRENICLRIGVESTAETDFRFGITLYGPEGTAIAAAFGKSSTSNPELPIKEFDIEIQNPGLAPGTYWFTIGILRGSKELIDLIQEVLHFEVLAAENLPEGITEWNPGWGQIELKMTSSTSAKPSPISLLDDTSYTNYELP